MIGAVVLAVLCLCGEAPERENDFFWENDKVGFRAYGPRDPHLWSGIDVFNKGHVEDEVVKLLRGKVTAFQSFHISTLMYITTAMHILW